jgi:hypothetical protein
MAIPGEKKAFYRRRGEDESRKSGCSLRRSTYWKSETKSPLLL